MDPLTGVLSHKDRDSLVLPVQGVVFHQYLADCLPQVIEILGMDNTLTHGYTVLTAHGTDSYFGIHTDATKIEPDHDTIVFFPSSAFREVTASHCPSGEFADHRNTYRAAGIRQYADAHDWLTSIHLPTCAPDLNPVEGIWSLLRRGPLANTAFADADHLTRTLRHGLRQIHYRPDLIDGCLTEAGLAITRHDPTPTRKLQ
nr:transposase [Streptomyces luteoverticillatus]